MLEILGIAAAVCSLWGFALIRGLCRAAATGDAALAAHTQRPRRTAADR
jgi:hypothetical protein